jgi:hypothetical protein
MIQNLDQLDHQWFTRSQNHDFLDVILVDFVVQS